MDNANTLEKESNRWWQEKGEEMLKTGEYSDLEIVVEFKDDPVKRIRVHKCFLHLISPIWSSAVRWAANNEIKIKEHPYSVIMSLITCGYVNKLHIESLDHCLGVMVAADYYDMASPMDFCNEYIQEYIKTGDVDVQNIVRMLNVAVILKLNAVRAYCVAFIEDNTKRFFQSEEFLESNLDAVKMLTNIQNHLCAEDFLIRSVLRWCKTHSEEEKITLKEFVSKHGFVQNFRWPLLTTNERIALIADFPGVFDGEFSTNLTYDMNLAANEARGDKNDSESHCIIVQSPPYTITEKFIYFGESTVLPIVSLRLSPRSSSIDNRVTKVYEDNFIIQIMDRQIEFDGIVSDLSGPVVAIPPPALLIPLSNKSCFTFKITFKKTGVYFKNTNYFEYGQGLFRSGGGIIENIYNSDDAHDPTSSSGA